MQFDKKYLRVYAVTDRRWLEKRHGSLTLPQAVEEAILGGATMIQLREKELGGQELIALARRVRKVTAKYDVPLIIDDNIDVALSVGADGVHVGQSDTPAAEARRRLGAGMILGVSARSPEEALRAEADGADYLGCGDIFGTSTKDDARRVSYDIIKKICGTVKIPVAAIGGVNALNVSRLAGTGVAGAAVVSAVFAADDIRSAAVEIAAAVATIL